MSAAAFDDVLTLVIRVLQAGHLGRFLRSHLYRKYLNELFCRIQTAPYAVSASSATSTTSSASKSRSARTKGLRRSGSNSSLSTSYSGGSGGGGGVSADVSISAQNTLLASMSSSSTSAASKGKVLRGMTAEKSMLSPDLFDPDSIWRRRQHTAVNIGHVDELGRYRSAFERLPTSSSSAGVASSAPTTAAAPKKALSRVFRRFVTSNDIDKMQEELAWQMAEMVVNDVMEITSPDRSRPKLEEEKEGR